MCVYVYICMYIISSVNIYQKPEKFLMPRSLLFLANLAVIPFLITNNHVKIHKYYKVFIRKYHKPSLNKFIGSPPPKYYRYTIQKTSHPLDLIAYFCNSSVNMHHLYTIIKQKGFQIKAISFCCVTKHFKN